MNGGNLLNNLLQDKRYFKGKGGTGSTAMTEHNNTSFFHWTDEELKTFRKGAFRKCIAVFSRMYRT